MALWSGDMGFKSVSETIRLERGERVNARKDLLSFGIKYLDDALIGISKSDLVLLGAPSGVGKTQICTNIALANIANGKKVHFLALEAERFEIERRLKYQFIAHKFFSDPNRPRLNGQLAFDRWRLGDFLEDLEKYEKQAEEFMSAAYSGLNVFYKSSDFTVTDLVRSIVENARKSDLFIVDHAHFFDLDDDNENRALKAIAKTIRALVLEESVPVLLVAHLRKRDRHNDDLVPGIDEFHGSSDLTKIATRVVTIGPGERTSDGCYETFFRIPKDRVNGGSSRVIGRMIFDPKKGCYEEKYKVGRAGLTRKTGFEELDITLQPEWARRGNH